MTVYEHELMKIFGDSELLSADTVSSGKTMISKIGADLRAKIQFVTSGHANHYDALRVSIIKRNEGNTIYDKDRAIYYSFGVLQSKNINVYSIENYQLVYLGIDYKDNDDSKDNFRLDLFGKIISDPSRIKILEYIQRNGSATVSDINHIFGYSGTTSYYHLNMMQKAGMIKIKNRGKAACYFVNSEYFSHISSFLQLFIKILLKLLTDRTF